MTVRTGMVPATPALLNSTSTGPSMASTAASTSASALRSVWRNVVAGPDGSFTSSTVMCAAPSSATSSSSAAPTPEYAPVMTTRLPS